MKQSRLLIALISSLMLAIAGTSASQTTAPASPDKEWEAQVAQTEAEAASLPKITAESPSKLIKFDIDSDMLIASAVPAPSPQEVRVVSPMLKGVIRLKWFNVHPGGAGSVRGDQDFQFLQQDLTSADDGQINTMISSVAGRLLLSRDSENGKAFTSIQLIEDPPLPPGAVLEQDPVRLLVNKTSTNPDAADNKLQVSARSFLQLRLTHSAEVDEYLRPIVRDFQQEAAVFAIPSEIAWQVLGGNYGGDDALKARIKDLIAKLDLDDFRQRRSAMDELQSLGQPGVMVLMKMDRSNLSLQQNTEIDSYLANKAPLTRTATHSLVDDKNFLLDVLHSDDPALRAAAIKRLNELTGKSFELDPSLNQDARAQAIAKLRAQLTASTQPGK